MEIPFCQPPVTALEVAAAGEAVRTGQLGGNGSIGRRVEAQLKELTGATRVLLTPNATQAMEIALIAYGIGPGDEVLMPSFAFVSQANAILARGAKPIFCEIDEFTLNMCPEDAERRCTPRTKMIMPVHYAGVGCDLDAFVDLARRKALVLFEDAAQGIGARYRGRHLGSVGDAACISFHVTKNIVAGEGGCLLLRDDEIAPYAEIIREKGTNRSAFQRGEIDRYTWVGPGGSFVLSDLLAAVLEVQLTRLESINQERMRVWNRYQAGLEALEKEGFLRRPHIPVEVEHNAHIYAVRTKTRGLREHLLTGLAHRGIQTTFHFQPLHAAPFAEATLGRAERLPITEAACETLLRLPLYPDLRDDQVDRVLEEISALCTEEER